MITYPVWEIDCRLVASGNGEVNLLLWFVGDSGCGNISGNGNTGPPKVVCDAADVKIDVVHLAKLLCCFLVVAPRLRIKLDLMVAVLPLTMISGLHER